MGLEEGPCGEGTGTPNKRHIPILGPILYVCAAYWGTVFGDLHHMYSLSFLPLLALCSWYDP